MDKKIQKSMVVGHPMTGHGRAVRLSPDKRHSSQARVDG
jgi:hypothetical protein